MLLSLFVLLFKRKSIEKKHLYILLPGIVYLFFGFIGNIFTGYLNFYSFKQSLLIMVTSVAAMGFHYYTKEINTSFSKIKLMFLAIAIINLGMIGRFTLTNLLESVYAFIYGIFILYFMMIKDYKFMILSIILCILANKRIAEGAVIVTLLIIIHLSLHKNKKIIKILLTVYILGFILFSYYIVYASLNGQLISFLRKLSVFSMGRDFIWGLFSSDCRFDITYFGQGIGYVSSKLEFLNYSGSGNMHNDLFATYIEIGFLGFGFWILSYFYFVNKLYKLNNNSIKTLIILMGCIFYTMIIYTTDNTLIYIEYWLPLILIFLEVSDKHLLDKAIIKSHQSV